jgi:hypothetical protein
VSIILERNIDYFDHFMGAVFFLKSGVLSIIYI